MPDHNQQWTYALHEASHAAHGLLTWHRPTVAILLSDGGVVYSAAEGDLVAVNAAAGRKAEDMANRYGYGCPEDRSADGVAVPAAFATAAAVFGDDGERKITEDRAKAIPDGEAVGRWCVCNPFFYDHPEAWQGRYERVHRAAAAFVEAHADLIAAVAELVYRTGKASLFKGSQAGTIEVVDGLDNTHILTIE